jgi:hypothetical protein
MLGKINKPADNHQPKGLLNKRRLNDRNGYVISHYEEHLWRQIRPSRYA